MKREKLCNCLIGGMLAFLLAFGTVGSMTTGLELTVSGMGFLALACAGAAILSAGCYQFRFGGALLLCLMTAITWLYWRDGEAGAQTLAVLYRMCHLYNNAYGWGIPALAAACRDVTPVDAPLMTIGVFVAVAVSWTVCRRKPAVFAIGAGALPLFTCFVVTDTVPDSIYLYIWLLSAAILILTGSQRRRNLAQSIRLTVMAAVGATIALALLFWAVPQEGYDKHPAELQEKIIAWAQQLPSLWEEVSERSSGSGTTTDTLNLSHAGPKQKSTTIVMDVMASEGGALYLRGQDHNTYDGTRWTAARRRSEDFPEGSLGQDAGEVTISTRRVRDVLYLPYYPAESVSLVGGQVPNEENRRAYTFARQTLPDNWRQMIRASEDSQPGVYFTFAANPENYQATQTYLVLPKETRVWAQELLENLLTDEKSATAVADTIGDYVRSSAVYDLNTRRMPTEKTDFARWFLEESDTGYCVHFATAATVLLRAAGVEARYVEGYLVQAEAGTQVAVRAHQAHAWVEYYEPVLDTWIVLEATPPDLSAGEETTAATDSYRETVPSEVETTAPSQTDASEAEEAPIRVGEKDEANVPPAALTTALKWLLFLGVLAAVLPGQRLLRLHLRRQRQTRGRTNARALALWREVSYLHRLLKTQPPAELEQLAQKAKFSQYSLTGAELSALEQGITSARHQLQGKNSLARLIDQYVFAAY